jgi:hypothetical protein
MHHRTDRSSSFVAQNVDPEGTLEANMTIGDYPASRFEAK